MIQLHSDCLVFKFPEGDIPCSASELALEFRAEDLDPKKEAFYREVLVAVLHYFRQELRREAVSPQEFAEAFTRALQGFGLKLEVQVQPAAALEPARVIESDLARLAIETSGLELAFFMRLRTELEVLLRQAPRVLRFRGLRGCVKELTRTRRWCQRCQRLNDDIIEYLRQCLSEATQAGQCSLVIG